jgi:hydroxyacylglutathione hydrolase
LPDQTLVYCAHEYTSDCLPFALACEPDNPDIRRRIADTRALRAKNLPTVPFTIALEKATNPYLRCASPALIRNLQRRGLSDTAELAVFTALGEWRARF